MTKYLDKFLKWMADGYSPQEIHAFLTKEENECSDINSKFEKVIIAKKEAKYFRKVAASKNKTPPTDIFALRKMLKLERKIKEEKSKTKPSEPVYPSTEYVFTFTKKLDIASFDMTQIFNELKVEFAEKFRHAKCDKEEKYKVEMANYDADHMLYLEARTAKEKIAKYTTKLQEIYPYYMKFRFASYKLIDITFSHYDKKTPFCSSLFDEDKINKFNFDVMMEENSINGKLRVILFSAKDNLNMTLEYTPISYYTC